MPMWQSVFSGAKRNADFHNKSIKSINVGYSAVSRERIRIITYCSINNFLYDIINIVIIIRPHRSTTKYERRCDLLLPTE